jgi:hypothetical protein
MQALRYILLCFVLGLAVYGLNEANAVSPGLRWITRAGGLNCPSATNLSPADIECVATGDLADYSAVLLEVDSATPVYFCGNNTTLALDGGGVTPANVATSCVKRCTDSAECPGGASFVIEVKKQGGGKCWSGAAADGGVVTRVQCLR